MGNGLSQDEAAADVFHIGIAAQSWVRAVNPHICHNEDLTHLRIVIFFLNEYMKCDGDSWDHVVSLALEIADNSNRDENV